MKASMHPPARLARRRPCCYLDAVHLLVQLLYRPLDPLRFLLGFFQGLFQKGLRREAPTLCSAARCCPPGPREPSQGIRTRLPGKEKAWEGESLPPGSLRSETLCCLSPIFSCFL